MWLYAPHAGAITCGCVRPTQVALHVAVCAPRRCNYMWLCAPHAGAITCGSVRPTQVPLYAAVTRRGDRF